MKDGIKLSLAVLATLLSAQVFADPQAAANQQEIGAAAMAPADSQSVAVKNKAAGEAFLEANKSKPGVIALPSGLQYKVINDGKGVQPSDNDTVTVNYAGTLIDGTEFDSSYKRGQPISFPLNGVIPGWVEALKLMKAGATWEIYIPAKLAYGEQGVPPVIGPNQTLIFKVNLIDVKKS